jgi:hypothetical protein
MGDPFTWRNNHHVVGSYIRERLDRAVANNTWRNNFPLVKVTNGDPRHSDHRPVIVDVGDRDFRRSGSSMKVLKKFEARWLEEEECSKIVEQAWKVAMEKGKTCVMDLQGEVLEELWVWDKDVLGELERRIKKVKKELESWRQRCISQEQVNQEHLLWYKLERLQDQLNVHWKQRAHTAWLLKGDRNTKFFHAYASKRRMKNTIKNLKDEEGRVVAGKG